MSLQNELTRLREQHDEGTLPEREFRAAVQRLVTGGEPQEMAALTKEVKKLKYEAALVRLDHEFASVREQCLIQYRWKTREPAWKEFRFIIVRGAVLSFLLVALALWTRSTRPVGDEAISFVLAAVCAVATFFEAKKAHAKCVRFSAAWKDWQRNRGALAREIAALTNERVPAAVAAAVI